MLIYGLRLHEPVRTAKPDTNEASQVPYKGRLHVHGVQHAILSLERGLGVSHERIKEWVATWGRSDEQPLPIIT
jgi:hypothetical protein